MGQIKIVRKGKTLQLPSERDVFTFFSDLQEAILDENDGDERFVEELEEAPGIYRFKEEHVIRIRPPVEGEITTIRIKPKDLLVHE